MSEQPKTQEELQARVLGVLRQVFPEARVDLEGDYRLFSALSHNQDTYLSIYGVLCRPPNSLLPEGLKALTAAAELLEAGVAKPSKVDRAMEVLRPFVPGIRCSRPDIYCDKPDLVGDSNMAAILWYGTRYDAALNYRFSAEALAAITEALNILNGAD